MGPQRYARFLSNPVVHNIPDKLLHSHRELGSGKVQICLLVKIKSNKF